MNEFANATCQRLRERLHDLRAEHAGTLGNHDDHDIASFLKRSRLLGLLIEGAAGPAAQSIVPDVVGYGTEVHVTDLRTGLRARHRLMSGDAMVLEAGHISVDSPMGSALLGRRTGDVVRIALPGGERELRVDGLQTLDALLNEWAEKPTSLRTRIRTGTDG
jgi:transcription elongation GreA/GreB family factor